MVSRRACAASHENDGMIAVTVLIDTLLKQPIKVLATELSTLVPFLGQILRAGMSIIMVEAFCWELANDMVLKLKNVKKPGLLKCRSSGKRSCSTFSG